MKKLSHVPCFLTSTAKPKSYRDKTQMFLRSRSVRCLLSHVIVDAIADSIPRFLLVPNVVLNSLFSCNGKGYDNSRFSDDIHRGSRQIHDKWLRFTCPSCISSQNGLAMKTSVNLYKNISHLYYMK